MKRGREPEDALIIEAAVAGASLAALGAGARFRELLYDGAMLRGAAAPCPSPSASELAVVASRPDLNSADLLRSSRDVFHHLRKPTDLDEMRKTLQKPVPSTVWPANALARIEGPRSIDCFVSTSSFVIGRGSKCDLDLGADFPSLVVSRRSATLSLRSDGNLWLACNGSCPVFADGVLVSKGSSVRLRACSSIQIGPHSLVVSANVKLLAKLS